MLDEILADGWSPAVARQLAGLLEGPGVAVFDFDDTCIDGDLGDAVFHHAVAAGSLTARLPGMPDAPTTDHWLGEADRILAEEGPETGYPFFVRAFAGWTVTGFRRHARDVLAVERGAPRGRRPIGTHRVRSGIRYRRRVVRLIERLQRASWQVWIVSGTAEWAVEVGAEELGVPPERVCGQRVELEGQRLTAEPVHPTVFGAGKVEVLRGLLDAPPDLAVGDSPNDLQLLQWARRAVVLDAGDANSLGPLARSRGWSVQPVASSWRPDLFG